MSNTDIIELLRQSRDLNGSDLHLMVGAPPSARVHGSLLPINNDKLTADQTRELILDILDDSQRSSLEKNREHDFAIQVREVGRFRGNAHFVRGAIEAAFRHIPEEIPEMEDIGHGETVAKLCTKPQGLVLVTGMTGSGKSTTMAAMIKRISEPRSPMIVTIEDPIEHVFQHAKSLVKQRQVGSDTQNFANALRAALRQDPDVIMVSEMRDLETIRTAITAAETGHLVIGTLHTQDAPRAIDRLVDVFPADQQQLIITQLSNCIEGIISQRLVERADAPGRVMISEILIGNHAVRTCIREHKWSQLVGLMQVGYADGMHTFDDSLSHLAKGGFITPENAMLLCRDKVQMAEDLAESGIEVTE